MPSFAAAFSPQALAAVLLVPPVNLAVLALACLLLRRHRLALAALLPLTLLAVPAVSVALLAGLERGLPAAQPAGAPPPAAIIILGGDVAETAPGTDLGALTLARVRAGAALARATHLPVLVTGGPPARGEPPVAALMARSLAEDFAVAPRWVEPQARDTWDNARLSAAVLRRDGIASAYLVTHAWHMRRALLAFAGAGFAVVPAPLPADRVPATLDGWVPRVSAWLRGYLALHEWIGCAWYAWYAWRAGAPG